MATVNMEDLPEAPATIDPNAKAVVPATTRAVAPYVEDEDAMGEFDRNDRQNAMLVIVAKTGELSNLFTPGDMLLNKEFVIGGVKSPLELVAVAIRKCYQNDLDFDGGDMGDVVDKMIEVTDRGGVLGYRGYDDKESTHFWKPILQTVLLIKKPDGMSPAANSLFPFSIEGVDYGRVGYAARTKTAYNGIAKTLIATKQDKGSVRVDTFRLSVKGETWQPPKGPPRSWMDPMLRVVGPTSETMLEFLKNLPK